jgi:hypothetical protein
MPGRGVVAIGELMTVGAVLVRFAAIRAIVAVLVMVVRMIMHDMD